MLPEITSSGLSHTQADFFPQPQGNMRMFSPRETTEGASPIFMDYNYGSLLISGDAQSDSDILLSASVRNISGDEVLRQDYTK